ncbi:cyclic pyranopterin phosphate synthase [Lachnospiraceae bacterium PF1-22]
MDKTFQKQNLKRLGIRDVYTNANFSIVIDKKCNAACDFCVEALRSKARNSKLDDSAYLEQLDTVLKLMRSLNTSISITGGEPTISSKLLAVLKKVNDYGFRKRVITTNGSHLLSMSSEGKTILDHIIENRFNHLNISKASFNEADNYSLMHYSEGCTTNDDLRIIIPRANKNNLQVRMSCVINKKGIYTFEDVIQYIEFYNRMGCNQFVFRELMNYKFDKDSNREKERFYKQNFVDIQPAILDFIEKDDQFQLIKEVKGYYYNVLVYQYGDCSVCFEKANLVKMKERDSKIYEFILHENGRLCGSWDDSEELIFKMNDSEALKEKAYIAFILGYDLLQQEMDELDIACDDAFELANDFATMYLQSGYQENYHMSDFECLVQWIEHNKKEIYDLMSNMANIKKEN